MPTSGPRFLRDVLLAFARMHILHHAAEARIYGAGMARELSRHGYRLGPGTLYPMLQGLHADGLLSASSAVIGGKRRKHYAITRRGSAALERLRPKLAELSAELLPSALDAPAGGKPSRT